MYIDFALIDHDELEVCRFCGGCLSSVFEKRTHPPRSTSESPQEAEQAWGMRLPAWVVEILHTKYQNESSRHGDKRSYLPLSCVQNVPPVSLPLRLSALRFLFAGLVLPFRGYCEQQYRESSLHLCCHWCWALLILPRQVVVTASGFVWKASKGSLRGSAGALNHACYY